MEIGRRFARAGAITATAAWRASSASAARPRTRSRRRRRTSRGARPHRRPSRLRRSRRSSTASRRTSSRPTRRTGSAARCGSSRSSTPTATARRTACTRTTRCRRRPSTDGLKVPVIYEDSPYYAGTAPSYSNWNVDHELGAHAAGPPVRAVLRPRATRARRSARSTSRRGCRAASPSCTPSRPAPATPTAARPPAARNETLGADRRHRLAQRPRARRTRRRTGDVEAAPVNWHNGHTAMMGTSYNGTIPIAAATTGVQGLDAIVPISAISRLVRLLPRQRHGARAALRRRRHRQQLVPGRGPRRARRRRLLPPRRGQPARPRDLPAADRRRSASRRIALSGNRNAFWDERNYMKDVKNVHAAALIAHGNNDFNVMTKNAAQFFEALKAQGVPHQFYFHQGGHGGAPPDAMINRWFTKYLWGQDNGVENQPKSWVVREAATCPPRQTTVTGDQSNTATLTVASTSPFMVGQQLTIPQSRARPARSRTPTSDHQHPGRDAHHGRDRRSPPRPARRSPTARSSASPAARPTRRRTPSGPIPPPRRSPRSCARAAPPAARSASPPAPAYGDADRRRRPRRHDAARRGDLAEPPDLPDEPLTQDIRISRRPVGHAEGRLQQDARRTCRPRWSATRHRQHRH